MKWIRWDWFFGSAILVFGVMVMVGVWMRADWWRWDIFLGLLAIGISLLFGAWSVSYQIRSFHGLMKGYRRQSVSNGYGLLMILSRLQGFKNCKAGEWVDTLYDASEALDKMEKESKDKLNKVLG